MNTNALHTHSPLAPAGRAVGADVRVHVLATGRLVGNRTFLRAEGWSGLIRRPEPVEFPVLSYAVEHPEGLIVIDTGLAPGVRVARSQRRFAPTPVPGSRAGIADRIRAAGLDPADVRRVVITHLDWDHAGNLDAFPRAEVLVHRPEWRYAATAFGRARYQGARMWPAAFTPTLIDRLLRDEPTVLLPAHDDDAPARLAALETAPPPAG